MVWRVFFALCVVGCGAPLSPSKLPLIAGDGSTRTFDDLVRHESVTAFVFVSADCPCLHAHLDRLRAIARDYSVKGVQLVAVDSEVGAEQRWAAEVKDLGLPFPLFIAKRGRLADALGAEYATYSVVVDGEGRVVYRGGIDTDKRLLHESATSYLRDALDDVLAKRSPRRSEGKTLGCTLRTW